MGKHGLTFDRANEEFVVADERVFLGWLEFVAGIKPPFIRSDAPETSAKPEGAEPEGGDASEAGDGDQPF